MPFPWTLQRYIFREMGKTFLLTAAALTCVLGLGGGVFQVIELGEVTPGQLVRLMGFVLPVSAALTLPIAALFSATVTYGRLSADNEFVACRSSGINMHVLFVPTIVLSLASACVTFALINFVIPGMVRNLNKFLAPSAASLVQQQLRRPRGLTLGGRFRIRADPDNVEVIDANHIGLYQVVFAELDDDEWVRFGTAREVHLNFDLDTSRAWGRLVGLSYYDRREERFVSSDAVTIPPNDLPSVFRLKLRYLNLGELLRCLRNPGAWPPVAEEMQRLRFFVAQRRVYEDLWSRWLDNRVFRLGDDAGEYIVRSEQGIPPGKGGLELINVTVEENRSGRHDLITAERAIIEVVGGGTLGEAGIEIELCNAVFSDERATVERSKKALAPMPIDPEIVAGVEALRDEQLLKTAAAGAASDPLANLRGKARAEWDETVRRIVATLHERMAFAVSVLVLVILGAALGIVLRGSHVLTAFGISFVPSLLVIIAIVMGKQMAHNAPTYVLGLAVMWSGIALVAALDFWMLTRVLRR